MIYDSGFPDLIRRVLRPGSRNSVHVQAVWVDQDIERIKAIIDERNQRYAPKGGSVMFAGLQDGSVKIAPAGFCWR